MSEKVPIIALLGFFVIFGIMACQKEMKAELPVTLDDGEALEVYTGGPASFKPEEPEQTCVQTVDWYNERWNTVCWQEKTGQICVKLPHEVQLTPCGDSLCLAIKSEGQFALVEIKESRLHSELIPLEGP